MRFCSPSTLTSAAEIYLVLELFESNLCFFQPNLSHDNHRENMFLDYRFHQSIGEDHQDTCNLILSFKLKIITRKIQEKYHQVYNSSRNIESENKKYLKSFILMTLVE